MAVSTPKANNLEAKYVSKIMTDLYFAGIKYDDYERLPTFKARRNVEGKSYTEEECVRWVKQNYENVLSTGRKVKSPEDFRKISDKPNKLYKQQFIQKDQYEVIILGKVLVSMKKKLRDMNRRFPKSFRIKKDEIDEKGNKLYIENGTEQKERFTFKDYLNLEEAYDRVLRIYNVYIYQTKNWDKNPSDSKLSLSGRSKQKIATPALYEIITSESLHEFFVQLSGGGWERLFPVIVNDLQYNGEIHNLPLVSIDILTNLFHEMFDARADDADRISKAIILPKIVYSVLQSEGSAVYDYSTTIPKLNNILRKNSDKVEAKNTKIIADPQTSIVEALMNKHSNVKLSELDTSSEQNFIDSWLELQDYKKFKISSLVNTSLTSILSQLYFAPDFYFENGERASDIVDEATSIEENRDLIVESSEILSDQRDQRRAAKRMLRIKNYETEKLNY